MVQVYSRRSDENRTLYVDREKTRNTLRSFLVVENPVFWNHKEKFSTFEKQVDEKTFRFLTWTLPIRYEKVVWHEKEIAVREYSYDQARKVAKQIAREQLKRQLPSDATIQGEKVLHVTKENGKVKVEMHYQVIENIATPQPIIQGD